jgi:predicted negative regulator of RcsB-dependent stress response
MAPKKKYSRKELLKKNPEVIRTVWTRMEEWVNANQKTLGIVATVLVVVVGVVFGVHKYGEYREAQAMALYAQAQDAYGPDGAPVPEASAKALKTLASVAHQYPSTKAARYAQLEQANLLYSQGRIKEADKLYSASLERYRQNDELDTLAKQGLAYCRLAEGSVETAVKLFQDIAAGKLAAESAQLNLGLIYERQGKLKEAVAAYEKAAAGQVGGPEAGLAKARLEQLAPPQGRGGA